VIAASVMAKAIERFAQKWELLRETAGEFAPAGPPAAANRSQLGNRGVNPNPEAAINPAAP